MNLDDLNNSLFALLEDIKSDKIEVEKAKAMTSVANTIINSVRTQIQGISTLNGAGVRPKVLGDVEYTEANQLGRGKPYDRKNAYAQRLGYKSLAEAIAKMGKESFENSFTENN